MFNFAQCGEARAPSLLMGMRVYAFFDFMDTA
jgi:hypothetical protein